MVILMTPIMKGLTWVAALILLYAMHKQVKEIKLQRANKIMDYVLLVIYTGIVGLLIFWIWR